MADYDDKGELIAAGRDIGGTKAWCHVMYALHAVSAFGGLLSSATDHLRLSVRLAVDRRRDHQLRDARQRARHLA